MVKIKFTIGRKSKFGLSDGFFSTIFVLQIVKMSPNIVYVFMQRSDIKSSWATTTPHLLGMTSPLTRWPHWNWAAATTNRAMVHQMAVTKIRWEIMKLRDWNKSTIYLYERERSLRSLCSCALTLQNETTDVPTDRTNMPERENWDKGVEFLMSCIAMSVGLGNVWRFPFTALENGGGAFLIPYLIVLLVVGRPLYYLEMIIGQFSSRGSVKAFDLAPAMRGKDDMTIRFVFLTYIWRVCLTQIMHAPQTI